MWIACTGRRKVWGLWWEGVKARGEETGERNKQTEWHEWSTHFKWKPLGTQWHTELTNVVSTTLQVCTRSCLWQTCRNFAPYRHTHCRQMSPKQSGQTYCIAYRWSVLIVYYHPNRSCDRRWHDMPPKLFGPQAAFIGWWVEPNGQCCSAPFNDCHWWQPPLIDIS